MAIERGTVFGGRYVVQSQVGTGGMATVYSGLDQTLDRRVAIKVMLARYAQDPSFAARFKQEAQAAAALQSPYIVSVYDWGKEGDTYYIIMEYLRGTDLKTGIRTHGAIAPRKVAQIGAQVCSALSVAHRHDIIHRDIKPQNIMIQPNGDAKVMDFGIARSKNSHLTQTNSVLGTAHYVSPEQAMGKELGPTSDLYSLGVVMYEAACGKLPFDGDDAVSVALKQVNEQPVPPSEINPNVPADFEAIIMKCMAKDPAQRFQSADELRRVLNNFIAGRQVNIGGERTTVLAGGAAATSVIQQNGGRGTQPLRPVDTTRQMPANRAGAQPLNRSYTPAGASGQAGRIGAPARGGLTGAAIAGIAAAIIFAIILIVVLVVSLNSCSGGSFIGGGTATSSTKDASASSEQAEVPDLRKLTVQQATNKLDSYEFALGSQTTQASSDVPKGQVISQTPAAGTMAAKGTKVDIVVSAGTDTVQLPATATLKGATEADFQAKIAAVGLTAQHDESMDAFDSTVEQGLVVTWTSMNSTAVAKGTIIKYGVSKGPDTVELPDMTGYTYEQAQSTLASLGLTMNENWDDSDTVEQNYVISTEPGAGQVEPNSTVLVHFSKGASKVTVTDVTGWNYTEAENELHNRLGLGYSEQWVSDSSAYGTVLYTDPAAGQQVSKNTTVNIYISSGPKQAVVPDVTGWSSSSAAEAIRNAGFTPNAVTDQAAPSADAAGTVYYVDGAGQQMSQGSTVTYYVYGDYVAPTPDPEPTSPDQGGDAGTTVTGQ